jgi:hypothetical protein
MLVAIALLVQTIFSQWQYIFYVLRSMDHLKSSKTSRVVDSYVFLSFHVNKSRIHVMR